MKLSRSAGYGLVAAAYVAQKCKTGPVLASRIADDYGIPLEYLLKIMQQLVRINVFRSKRGPRGGFVLARPASEITMLEIIEAVDGPLSGYLQMAEQTHNARFSVRMEGVCRKAAKEARAVYEKAKLSRLIGE